MHVPNEKSCRCCCRSRSIVVDKRVQQSQVMNTVRSDRLCVRHNAVKLMPRAHLCSSRAQRTRPTPHPVGIKVAKPPSFYPIQVCLPPPSHESFPSAGPFHGTERNPWPAGTNRVLVLTLNFEETSSKYANPTKNHTKGKPCQELDA